MARVNGGEDEDVRAALPELEELLRHPGKRKAFHAAIRAAGSAWDARATDLLVRFVDPQDHRDGIRLALAMSLSPAVSDDADVEARAIAVLTELTIDPKPRVRDWACFQLGQREADTPKVREALAARLHDSDRMTRYEALVALAKTGDARALDRILTLLARDPDRIRRLTLVAAAALADPVLLAPLRRVQERWSADYLEPDELDEQLAAAIERCTPDVGGIGD